MEISFIGGGVAAPKGFTANGIHCGIRKIRRKRISHLFTVKRTVTRRLFIRKILCAEHR